MSGNRDVLILPDPPAGDNGADLYVLNGQLEELADREEALSNIVSLYDQKDTLAPLSAADKEARAKYLGELQQIQDEIAQLESDRAELAREQTASPGTSRHIANQTSEWKAVCTAPDYCRVGDKVVPFDSFAVIDHKTKASPDVKAQSVPVYRGRDDLHKGVQADAGSHIVAGTSQDGGYVKFIEGQSNVKVNGIPVARHDNACIINCNAFGIGGTSGRLITLQTISDIALRPITEEDLKYYGERVAEANRDAEEITRKLEEAERELDKTSWWKPSDWDKRGQIKERIDSLKQKQQAADSWVGFYRQKQRQAMDVLHPGAQWIGPPPSASEQRLALEHARDRARLGIALAGPVFGAGGAIADMAGAPPEVVEGMVELGMSLPAGRGGGGRPVLARRGGTGRSGGGVPPGTRTKTSGQPGQGVVIKPKPDKLIPGTPEHKAQRWKDYQERGGKKGYEEWSKQYDTNMQNYQYGAAREAEYRKAMGATEDTLKTPLSNRQVDILKEKELYAGQLKTGPVSLTQENKLAIAKDAALVKDGWKVEHILEKGASKPYIEALEEAGIQYHIGPKIP